jgi:hypothetical protein
MEKKLQILVYNDFHIYRQKCYVNRGPMVLPVPGRMMVSRREEKKSPWASLGAVIALTAYLVRFPEDRW